MLRLDFTYDDLDLPPTAEKTRRASVSGVQEKVQLKRVRGGYEIVASVGCGGESEGVFRHSL